MFPFWFAWLICVSCFLCSNSYFSFMATSKVTVSNLRVKLWHKVLKERRLWKSHSVASGSELLHTVSGPLFTSSLGVGCVTAWIRTKPWGCWGHGLNREVWREPGDKCLLESSVRRRKGWEEPRITNTGNEFSTTTSSPLFGPPLLYSPGAEQMLVHLHDEVKFGVKIPALYRWH